jgi:hypothetical protein
MTRPRKWILMPAIESVGRVFAPQLNPGIEF